MSSNSDAQSADSSGGGEGKLRLFDAVAMSIGGMVGGGIFAVLGLAVHTAGNAAFISFGIAGLLALVTGICYSKLTIEFDEAGGSFTFVDNVFGPRPAGTLAWFLMLGYVFTISLYAHTFGAYAAELIGVPNLAVFLGIGVIALFAGLNLVGVRESGTAEDVLVYGKLTILLVTAFAGLFAVTRGQAMPIVETGTTIPMILGGGTLIFVGYEGFELLADDFTDMENRKKTLPKALMISIGFVIVLYMFIAFVCTGALEDSVIMAHKETVLAYVAQPTLGHAGLVIVLIAAVMSTASAVNATIFATGRLAKRVGNSGQLPKALIDRLRGGVPVWFVVSLAVASILTQTFANLDQISTFASGTFLLVFGVVNATAFQNKVFKDWKKILPILGTLGCFASLAVLMWHAHGKHPETVYLVAGISIVVYILRRIYIAAPEFKEATGKSDDSETAGD